MSIIVLIPLILCLVALLRSDVERTFLNVCIPVLMFLPTYILWKVPLLPPINFAEAVFLPLGIAMLATRLTYWKFTRTDVWIACLIVTCGVSDFQKGNTTIAIFRLFEAMTSILFPYMAGKLLIERVGARVAVCKRMIWWVFLISGPSMWEFLFKKNLFRNFWGRFFPEVFRAWVVQERWGFGRVAGPYAQSELAGMVLLSVLILTFWMGRWGYWEPSFAWFPKLPVKKGKFIQYTLLVLLYMGQARGPWLGAIFGSAVAFTGRSKNIVRATILTGVLLAIGGSVIYTVGQKYLNAPTTNSEQQTAQYRHELIDHYKPVAQWGGAWGWGEIFPRVAGQGSIDNQYLLTWITNGYLGAFALILVMLESVLAVVTRGFKASTLEDRHFSFSLAGILLGIMLTLGTVFLGSQAFQLFFLVIGWAQVVRETRPRVIESKRKTELVEVYT